MVEAPLRGTRRLVELLDDVAAAGFPGPPPGESWAGAVAGLVDQLEGAASSAVDHLSGRPDLLPLRLPKRRLLDLAACPRFALAASATAAAPAPRSPAVLGGCALDRFVVHELVAGAVADPAEDALAMLRAEGEWELVEELAALEDLPSRLGPLAGAARAFAGVGAAWWPRAQTQAGVELAGGAVVSQGRVDVELGGPLTGFPGVVVEVKSGDHHRDHLAELRHYALLVALRDGVPPAVAACWYPSGAWVVEAVTPDGLRSAARRLADAVELWSRLLAGATPAESAGGRCRRCPDADECASWADASGVDDEDPWEPEDDPWEPEVGGSDPDG